MGMPRWNTGIGINQNIASLMQHNPKEGGDVVGLVVKEAMVTEEVVEVNGPSPLMELMSLTLDENSREKSGIIWARPEELT